MSEEGPLTVQVRTREGALRITCSWGPKFLLVRSFHSVGGHLRARLLSPCCAAAYQRSNYEPGFICSNCRHRRHGVDPLFTLGSDECVAWLEETFEPLLAELIGAAMAEILGEMADVYEKRRQSFPKRYYEPFVVYPRSDSPGL